MYSKFLALRKVFQVCLYLHLPISVSHHFGGEIHSMYLQAKGTKDSVVYMIDTHTQWFFSKCLHWQMQICDNTIPRSTLQQSFQRGEELVLLFNLYQAGFLCASRSYPTPNWFLCASGIKQNIQNNTQHRKCWQTSATWQAVSQLQLVGHLSLVV